MGPRDKLILVGTTTFLTGAAAGVLSARAALRKRYAEIAEAEIAEAREYYRAFKKEDEFSTPQGMTEALGLDIPAPSGRRGMNAERAKEALAALASYQPTETQEEPDTDRIDPVQEDVEINVFVDGKALDPNDFDYDVEVSKRNPQFPYIITEDEFNEGALGFEQASITYYEGDDILCGSDDKPIDAVEDVVGEDHLHMFGRGASDPNTVHVRNETIEIDFEITRSRGSFSTEVGGFIRHMDDRHRGARRFRAGDDE